MTKQKKLMLDIFNSDFCCGKHRTAEELLDRAKELMPGISRATVYNNLHALESEGVIRKITAEGGADLYDSSNLLHGHLVCKECGKVNDVDLPALYDELCRATGKNLDSYELKMRYICKECMMLK
jgi:Fe2+ or Zn2+ uptake regulation protein